MRKHSLETIEKIRLSNLGKKRSAETKERMRQAHLGVKLSPKHRLGVMKTLKPIHKGQTYEEVFGIEIATRMKEKMRLAKLGKKMPFNKGFKKEKHPRWIKDRTKVLEKHRVRGTREWKEWRKSVFERDNYTCQECLQTNQYLQPHHIVPIRENMKKLFDLTNGITLCRPCHKKTVWKESDFAEKYSRIVAAHA